MIRHLCQSDETTGNRVMGKTPFQFPKAHDAIKRLINHALENLGIVKQFWSASCRDGFCLLITF